MPYTSISTIATGDTLTASYLNTLSDNAEFVYGLANRANTGFASRRTSTAAFDSTSAIWYFRHRLRYLHYRITMTHSPNHVRVFYGGTLRYAASSVAATSYTGYIDLYDLTTLPAQYSPVAWASGTTYDKDTLTSGDIVTNGGVYYRCTTDHTSGASTKPGVGASWTSNWTPVYVPAVGTWYSAYATVGFSEPRTVTVEPLDGVTVAVTSGLKAGDRVATQGATLINQVR